MDNIFKQFYSAIQVKGFIEVIEPFAILGEDWQGDEEQLEAWEVWLAEAELLCTVLMEVKSFNLGFATAQSAVGKGIFFQECGKWVEMEAEFYERLIYLKVMQYREENPPDY